MSDITYPQRDGVECRGGKVQYVKDSLGGERNSPGDVASFSERISALLLHLLKAKRETTSEFLKNLHGCGHARNCNMPDEQRIHNSNITFSSIFALFWFYIAEIKVPWFSATLLLFSI